jgi:predicted HicB family RNase H-like nuclease
MSGYVPIPCERMDRRRTTVADANVRIPAEARDRLAEVAAAEGMSLRAYITPLGRRPAHAG